MTGAQPSTEGVPDLDRGSANRGIERREPAVELCAEMVFSLPEFMREMIPDLAPHYPELQQLVLLNWLAVFLAADEKAIVDPAFVDEHVARLHWLHASWLWQMAGRYDRRTPPAKALDVLQELGEVCEEPASWEQVIGMSQAVYDKVENESTGCDCYGWFDAQQLVPGPPDPARFLRELADEIESAGGPLSGRYPDRRSTPPGEVLLDWVCRIRWVRPHEKTPELLDDGELWAAAAGRLRYWASYGGLFGSARILLGSGFRPPRPWADMQRTPRLAREECSGSFCAAAESRED